MLAGPVIAPYGTTSIGRGKWEARRQNPCDRIVDAISVFKES